MRETSLSHQNAAGAAPWILASGSRLLGLLVLTVALPMVVFTALIIQQTRHSLEEQARQYNRSTAQLAAQVILEHFQGSQQVLESYANRPFLRSALAERDLARLESQLNALIEQSPGFDRAFVASLDGTLVQDFPPRPTVKGRSFAHRDWFQGVEARQETYISEIYTRQATPRYEVVAIATPIRDPEGLPIGYLVAQHRVETVRDWLDGLKPSPAGRVLVVDRDGHLAERQRPQSGPVEALPEGPLKESAAHGADETRIGVDPETREPSLLSIQTIPGLDWSVIVSQPMSDVFSLVAVLHRTIMGLAIAVTVGMVGLSFLWLRGLNRFHVERQRAADEVMRLSRANSLLLEAAGEGIIGLDAEGKVTFVNPAAADLVGYAPHELRGQPLHETLHRRYPEGTPIGPHECPILAPLRDRAVHNGDQAWFWRKDGHAFPVEFTSTPVLEQERPTGVVLIFKDVSERLETERLQREHIEALEEAERYKDQFLSVLSHELRTPINAIMGFGSILEDELAGPLDPKQQEYVGRMLAGADTLLHLVNDLLDISRIQAGKLTISPHSADFDEIAGLMIEQLQPLAAQRRQTLIRAWPEGLPPVWADEPRVGQVLANLITNAIKFTPEGGQIVVRARTEGEWLRCEVSDTGPGLSPEDLPSLFERFTQVDMSYTRQQGGMGLGLFISKSLIEAHGGEIGVESTFGHGATFWFTLRRAPDDHFTDS